MNNVASAELAAEVSNAGGLGSIGGMALKPAMLRKELSQLKEKLHDKTCFGVDLLLPQLGGNARKTNYDYTEGHLPELIDIIIQEKARLFIAAVGIPPKWAVEKLHKAGILCMNMVGHPKHIKKAMEVGIDIVCCQGYEGGGHTGEVGTVTLIPMCLDAVKGHTSPLTGKPVHVVAAGGLYDGRGTAAMLAMGAQAVWIGTRFVASKEATTSKRHKQGVVNSGATDTIRTIIYSGRPMRVVKDNYNTEWEYKRQAEMQKLTSEGMIPFKHDILEKQKRGEKVSIATAYPLLCGQSAGGIHDVLPAKEIVESMTRDAADILRARSALVVGTPKL
eukprot:TRINITY_DN99_c1_g1_i3.p1 TRINITY_DN99_c1_g1~~TRINITY_DN99_c1_g1_i3.p1  ORF type:complete len:383 (+),score=167.71 TRINITY_DN99_c1_g1_i3:151-1149(+)